MISQATIEEVKNRMDIYEVVSDFVSLKKSGSGYKALSPFTSEKTPSFMVSPSKGIFKCFSSGKGGDAISFIMEMDGLSYTEAIRYLAQKYAIAIEEDEMSEDQQELQGLRESLFIVLNFAKDYYKDNLWNSDEGKSIGLSYFQERGFGDDTIKNFDLGYAFDQWDGLIKAAKEKGYNDEFLEQSGLKIVKEEKQYDRFRGRVIFPIHNITGKVIAFGARILKTVPNQPKYINSPETELYQKSHILYGIYQAKNTIRNEDNCYLVEGYTDVISLHQAGIHNVVASSGTALTEDQVKLIKRFSQNVTVLFDGDNAGIKASMRGIDMILEGGLDVRAVKFPDGEDPDSYCKKIGDQGFSEYLVKNAKDFISFKADFYISGNDGDPLKRAEAIREIVQSIALIPDPIKRTVYIQQSSMLLGVEESVLISEQNKLLLKSNRDKLRKETHSKYDIPVPQLQEEEEATISISEAVSIQEKESIRMLINYGADIIKDSEGLELNIIEYYLSEADDIQFETPVYKKILNIFKEQLSRGLIVDMEYFLDHDDPEIKKAAIDLAADRYEISPHWHGKYKIFVPHERDTIKIATYRNILRLKFRVMQKLIEDNMDKIKSTRDEKEIDELLSIQSNLKQMEMGIAEVLGNVTVR